MNADLGGVPPPALADIRVYLCSSVVSNSLIATFADIDVELDLPGKNFRPAPGEEILIPAGVIHSVRTVGTVTSRWRYGYREA